MASDAPRDPFDTVTPRRAPEPSTDHSAHAQPAAPTLEELPSANTRRWYRRDKRKVIAAVRRGALSFREACQRYRLSYQEFVDWERISGAGDRSWHARGSDERRRFHRIAMRSPASLRADGQRVECEIENLSATGAMLMVGDSRACPTQVALEVPHCRTALPARIAWRGRNALGIEFVGAPGMVAAQFDNRWVKGANALRREAR